ncbi:WXG100 family type VII secretion target [Streptomyces sp. NPDC020742]|uniref:WXG100 family type VII secretion target n=1 Tax=Streptomyces sp. NPDC020742 TaxID=3154897 RepID=UPI0033F65FBB
MAGQQQEQQPQIEKSFDLFNPGGDPSVLRACAEAWRHMAHDVKSTIETQDQEVTRLGDNWTGAAADAFHSHWAHTRGQAEKVLPQFASVAHQLDTTADAIQKANDEVHRVVEEIAATVAIGIGLTVLTAGVLRRHRGGRGRGGDRRGDGGGHPARTAPDQGRESDRDGEEGDGDEQAAQVHHRVREGYRRQLHR